MLNKTLFQKVKDISTQGSTLGSCSEAGYVMAGETQTAIGLGYCQVCGRLEAASIILLIIWQFYVTQLSQISPILKL